MTSLFEPLSLKNVAFRNRIAASPMCQYSAEQGVATDWHHVHLGGLARGGAGLVMVEATAVSPEGRITQGCMGLWNDQQAAALVPIVAEIRRYGAVPGIQIAHAGRKASANRPWEGDDHLSPDDPLSWEIIAPSALAAGGPLPRVPRAMNSADIARVQADFTAAAIRARDVGFDVLMLHFAHGYLAQSFFSPHANVRNDEYGGSFENRARFILETFRAVRKVWPEDRILTARLGVVEFDEQDAATLAESIELIRLLKAEGLDLIDISMGFTSPSSNIPWGPAFMAEIAATIRAATDLPVAASWSVGEPVLADKLVRHQKIDLAMLGRPLLAEPHWPYKAAQTLGLQKPAYATLPTQYAHWVDRYKIA